MSTTEAEAHQNMAFNFCAAVLPVGKVFLEDANSSESLNDVMFVSDKEYRQKMNEASNKKRKLEKEQLPLDSIAYPSPKRIKRMLHNFFNLTFY